MGESVWVLGKGGGLIMVQANNSNTAHKKERGVWGQGLMMKTPLLSPTTPPPPHPSSPLSPPPTHSLAEEGEARGAVLLQQRGEHAGHRLVLVQVLPVPLVLSLVIGHWFFGVDLGVNSSCHGSLVFGCGVVKCGVRWGGGICPVIGHSLVGRLNACLGGWVG